MQERNGKEFTKTSNWSQLKELHIAIHKNIQTVIDDNVQNNIINVLEGTQNVDKIISDLFFALNQVKKDNCTQNN